MRLSAACAVVAALACGASSAHAGDVFDGLGPELIGSELDGARFEAQLAFPGQVKQALSNWRGAATRSIGDRDFVVIQGTGPRGFLATLYFDPKTNLLSRLGRGAEAIDDYRQVLKYAPQLPEAHHNLGVLLLEEAEHRRLFLFRLAGADVVAIQGDANHVIRVLLL